MDDQHENKYSEIICESALLQQFPDECSWQGSLVQGGFTLTPYYTRRLSHYQFKNSPYSALLFASYVAIS
jgi:hypothetical protein